MNLWRKGLSVHHHSFVSYINTASSLDPWLPRPPAANASLTNARTAAALFVPQPQAHINLGADIVNHSHNKYLSQASDYAATVSRDLMRLSVTMLRSVGFVHMS